jgi:hypothetical protein
MRCACGKDFAESEVMGVEYPYGDPNRYDGVSEWRFPDGHRVGRWSGKILAEGESEKRYGGPDVR